MKGKTKAIITVFVVILTGIYYYAAIPAINIHSSETWFFIMIFLVILAVLYLGRKKMNRYEVRESKVVKGFLGVIVFLGVVYLLGTLFSSPVINAKKYQKLMTVKEGEFTKDVDELSFDKIPLLDKDTAALLGDRKMGSMVDMVSQFEADDIYSQINYKGNPVRVTPLKYASLIKWFTNQSEGIPSYIRINMANQSTELVKLKQGMKYTTSDHFNRNIYRHLRFAHPTYIYGELSFEIDENGDPYWIAPDNSHIDNIILVTAEEYIDYAKENILDKTLSKVSMVIQGGMERYDSVYKGLQCIKEPGYVFIHDGARPCISQKLIDDCYTNVVKNGACIAAVPVKDTIKIADAEGFAAETPDRSTLWQIQTPQVFRYDIIKESYDKLYAGGRFNGVTDDAMVLERYGEHRIKLVNSDYRNIKITTPEDMNTAEIFIKDTF